jgi:hypothetical protein
MKTDDELRNLPVSELRRLFTDTALVLPDELDLALREFSAMGRRADMGTSMLGAAAICMLLMLGGLTACLIMALTLVVKPFAALFMTILWGIVSAVSALQSHLTAAPFNARVRPVKVTKTA